MALIPRWLCFNVLEPCGENTDGVAVQHDYVIFPFPVYNNAVANELQLFSLGITSPLVAQLFYDPSSR